MRNIFHMNKKQNPSRRNAFMHGMSKACDLGAAIKPPWSLFEDDDTLAIQSDWEAVGEDLKYAFLEFQRAQ